MASKTSHHIIKGMNKDLSKSKFSGDFAYDAQNIRITAREGETLLSVTNEKGNSRVVTFNGSVLGYCVLDNYLTVFTKATKDTIYRVDMTNYSVSKLYEGDLNFSDKIETLGVYENTSIQKVYWVDGINQPRVINIVKESPNYNNTSFDFVQELDLKEEVKVTRSRISNGIFSPGTIQYAFTYYNKYGQESNIFYTTPLLYISHSNRGASAEDKVSGSFNIDIKNVDTKFDYIRVYSIHRTSIDAMPVVKKISDIEIGKTGKLIVTGGTSTKYVRPKSSSNILVNGKLVTEYAGNIETYTGGISVPGDFYVFRKNLYPDIVINVGNECSLTWGDNDIFYISKEANIGGPGNSYLRLIHADSAFFTQATKITKVDVTKASYVDTGTTGVDVDPTQLLYIGGEELIAGTLTQKDQTLFLGDLTIKRESIPADIKTALYKEPFTLSSDMLDTRDITFNNDTDSGYYSYNNSLAENTAGFKAGENYRIGVQFQHKSGKWSEPIMIGDIVVPDKHRPNQEFTDTGATLKIPTIKYSIPSEIRTMATNAGYKKMRAIVVFPTMQDRRIVLQGMLCPTVFNLDSRKNNTPFAQSSWFTRPNLSKTVDFSDSEMDNDTYIDSGAWVEFRHWHGLFNGGKRGAEIQGINYPLDSSYDLSGVNSAESYGDVFMVDQSILTMHSPDIEFDNNIKTLDGDDFKLRIVGIVNFTSSIGDIDIQTSSPVAKFKATGFDHRTIGNYQKDSQKNFLAARGLVSGIFFKDWAIDDIADSGNFGPYDTEKQELGFLVYPWHKTGSLNNDINRPADKGARTAVLKTKKISNLKFSKNNTWLNSYWYAYQGEYAGNTHNGITQVQLFDSNEVSLVKIPAPKNSLMTAINYYGNVDTLLPARAEYPMYKTGNFDSAGTFYKKMDTLGGAIGDIQSELKSFKDPVRMKYKSSPHFVFSLNYSTTTGSPLILPTLGGINKVQFSIIPYWLKDLVEAPVESDFIELKYANISVSSSPEYSNYDWQVGDLMWNAQNRTLYRCINPYNKYSSNILDTFEEVVLNYNNKGVKYRFKDTYYYYHFVVNYLGRWVLNQYERVPINGDSTFDVNQDSITDPRTDKYPYLFLAELYRDSSTMGNLFGGNSDDAIKENLWLPAGTPVTLDTDSISFDYGDTWYQRYDCLKTYAFTPEDENQVIEIASFMCETRVNIDGRYDRNRGQISNLNMSPRNFNLLNPVYSQKDNFFNYRILDKDYYKLNRFPTTITWSKEKSLAEEVDTWANITMANTLDLDGDKGKINALRTFNNEIFCFQDSGISNILFNSRVQIPSSDGVPIEISNGYKVDGKRYLSNTIGCKNKWSIAQSPNGLYFLDEDSNGLYLFNGQLDNISAKNSMENWVKNNKHNWYGTFYDKNNGDVYFTTNKESLVYSEKLVGFTSFMSYGSTDFMFNVDDSFYAINDTSLWKQFAGDYNSFYGSIKPYSITVISNQDMPYDKIFNNIEFRADSWNGSTLLDSTFDKLEVWNEYQYGILNLNVEKDKPSTLKKKFRVWRANIPRDTKNKRDRIRNTWAYVKLEKSKPSTERTELHDIMVHYFI